MAWRMRGEYFENCSCDPHCPCVASALQARPSKGYCNVVFAIHIDQGNYDGVRLDGLNWMLALTTPDVMSKGNATAALYVDQRASSQQVEAIGAIASGQAGGVPKLIGEMIPISKFLGVKRVPIDIRKEGLKRSVSAGDIAEIEIEAFKGADEKNPAMITNINHPFAENNALPLGKATRSSFKDYDFHWDNTGGNAHYSAFEWLVD